MREDMDLKGISITEGRRLNRTLEDMAAWKRLLSIAANELAGCMMMTMMIGRVRNVQCTCICALNMYMPFVWYFCLYAYKCSTPLDHH